MHWFDAKRCSLDGGHRSGHGLAELVKTGLRLCFSIARPHWGFQNSELCHIFTDSYGNPEPALAPWQNRKHLFTKSAGYGKTNPAFALLPALDFHNQRAFPCV